MFRDREKFLLRGLIATVTFAVVIAMSGGAARAGSGATDVSPSPSDVSQLQDVAVVSPTEVWAVGSYDVENVVKSLTLHLEDGSWSVVPSPDPSLFVGLSGVTALSSTDVWAVGSYAINPTPTSVGSPRTLAVHWDGLKWSRIWTPTAAGSDSWLSQVSGVSSDDVWAVGGYVNAAGNYQSLAIHWNGVRWSRFAVPHPWTRSVLSDIASTGASDAWAVGFFSWYRNRSGKNLMIHWDGTSWKRMWAPTMSTGSTVTSVSASSAQSYWAGGWNGYLLHFDGTGWSVAFGGAQGLPPIDAVSAGPGGDVWAVGTTVADQKLTFLRWTGTGWSVMPATGLPAGTYRAEIHGMDRSSPDDVWAVGLVEVQEAQGVFQHTLVMHWDGSTWAMT